MMKRESMERRPLRREYSQDFKAGVLAQIRQSGSSVSGVALSHGLHPNMVQRWRREDWQRSAAPAQSIEDGFVPLLLAPACDSPVQTESTQAAPSQVAVVESESIRIKLGRASGTLTVHWPVSAAGQCAQLLRELLR